MRKEVTDMATKQIGKLKYNISRRGIAYKWGDGEIHRFAFQRPQEEPEDTYEPEQGYDEGYDQDGYDEGYGRQPYEEYGYDNGDYNDSYDENGGENENDYPPQGNALVNFAFENEWFVWLALIVLPPLGIYLLWQKRQFDLPVRTGISAAALVWFILLLVLFFSSVFGDTNDNVTNPTNSVVQSSATPIPTPKATTAPTTAPTATPAPTPQAAGTAAADTGTTTTDTNSETVYFTPNGEYYHKQSVCGSMTDGTAASITFAQQQGKTACPTCYGMGTTGSGVTFASGDTSVTYYAHSDGQYFHSVPVCKGMKNAAPAISRAEAEARGQMPCPECLGYYSRTNGKYYHIYPTCSKLTNPDIVSLEVATKSRGQTACPVCMGNTSDTTLYWHTKGGDHYHLDKTCTNMKNATQCTLAEAVKNGQTPCPTCIGDVTKGTAYYCTKDGDHYHTDKTCSGMKNAFQVSVATAVNTYNKTPCPTCVGTVSTGVSNKVWFTKDGTYYHIESDCNGMKGAVQGTIEQAKQYSKTACPDCIGSSSAKVYGRKDGKYYHVVSDCSGMKDSTQITVSTAKKFGLTACPTCIGGSSSSSGSTTAAGYTSDGEKVEVYCTEAGTWYHTDPTCGGMKNAGGTTIAKATKAGKTACPTCIGKTTSTAGTTSDGEKVEVYCTTDGTYYHSYATCTGMKNAGGTTIAKATKAGKTPCPTCIGTTSSGSSKSVYATKYGVYYHLKSNCSGMAGATTYTVASATAAGKYACPVCVGASATKVYLTKNGDYYHVKSNCGGMTDPSFVALKDAVALGKDFCPDCIGADSAITKVYGTVGSTGSSGESAATGDYTGFTIYCTANGDHYHTKQHCGNMSGAKATTLSAAIAAGKTACPDCVQASSENTVYCRSDGRYYHTNATCSHMTNASKVTVAIAVANGKTACPTCAGGEMTGGSTSSSGSTTTSSSEKVYCTANGTYYHKTATSCGMKNAQATTKERAVQVYGKSPCPDCYDLNVSGSASVLTSVYWNPNGKWFHLESDCQGMKGAQEGTVAAAKAAGKTACPTCFNTDNSTRVFTTASDAYYHTKSVCGGEQKTIATTYTKAVAAGKKGCPSCTGKSDSSSSDGTIYVYATLGSKYYHDSASCSTEDLTGASRVTLEKAQSYGKTACGKCYN